MASSSIELAAQVVGKLVVEEVQYLRGVSQKVADLQSELEWMQCFLWDADEKQNKNALLRKWVSEIRDSALQAEDVIEQYILKVVKGKRQNKGLWSDLRWLGGCWLDAIKLHYVGSDIDTITAKISKMSSRLQTYGVKSSYGKYSSSVVMDKKLIADQRRTYPHLDGNDVVGLKQCVDDLAKELLVGTQRVVLVHGMGGIGKTTLAREVFNHAPLKGEFDGFAWAYISQQLQLGAVCREILLQLIPKNSKEERDLVQGLQDSLLPGKLSEMLKQKKYLVVLDDLWFSRDWRCLEPAFPISDTFHRSKLLVTTRDPHVLSNLATHLVFSYQVKLLDRDMSWKLLEEKANFKKESADVIMVELGERMLDHCNGHPLAIVVLGGVLATKKYLEEWQSIADNLPAHLQGDESYMGVYEVLAMSYYELPYYIKPCFLHLGNFPEDFDIPAQRLYDIWIAEGIVSSTRDKKVATASSLQDICEVYLNELVQKGMVVVGTRDSYGKIKTCRLHDLMRDKCLEMNKEENFLEIIDHQANKSNEQQPREKLRRMTIYVDNQIPNTLIPKSMSEKASFNPLTLRSLVFFPSKESKEDQDVVGSCVVAICKEFYLLRILDFEGVPLKGIFPKQVGRLIFLRYLSLRGTHITELPSSIGKLRSLMILDLRVAKVILEVPNVLWKLKSLRHLYLPSRILSQEVKDRQGYEIKEDEMLKLEQLSHLEKLEDVDLDRVDVKGLLELRSMRNLLASCVSKKESLDPIIQSRSIKILSLKINVNLVIADPMALSSCNSLKVLHIDGERNRHIYLPMKPNMYPQSLVELGFWYCKFPEDPMPLLETLPKLQNLQLRICYFGNELNCSEKAFPELTYLAIDGLFYLRKWEIKKGGFPKLRSLEIYNSPIRQLPDVLPSHIDIACNPCVRGIERYGCCPFFKGW